MFPMRVCIAAEIEDPVEAPFVVAAMADPSKYSAGNVPTPARVMP